MSYLQSQTRKESTGLLYAREVMNVIPVVGSISVEDICDRCFRRYYISPLPDTPKDILGRVRWHLSRLHERGLIMVVGKDLWRRAQ